MSCFSDFQAPIARAVESAVSIRQHTICSDERRGQIDFQALCEVTTVALLGFFADCACKHLNMIEQTTQV